MSALSFEQADTFVWSNYPSAGRSLAKPSSVSSDSLILLRLKLKSTRFLDKYPIFTCSVCDSPMSDLASSSCKTSRHIQMIDISYPQ